MSTELLQVRVERRANEAEDICSYELVSADGAPAGVSRRCAHRRARGARAVRQYSLCNPPHERTAT
jgi:vanillate O-demethylase ferredoxin subunit